MNSCSLQLDLRRDTDAWYWRVSSRRVSPGDPGPLHWDTALPAVALDTVKELVRQIIKFTELVDLRRHGKVLSSYLFSTELIDTFSRYDKGDIHFMVPAEWSDVPFELCFLDRVGFLGTAFEMGTSICRGKIPPICKHKRERVVVRVTDDPNISYNMDEAETIVSLVKRSGMDSLLATLGGAKQLIRKMEDASIFHFSGRSNIIDGMAYWLLEGNEKLGADEIAEELEHSPNVPYLVFSNSCRNGNGGPEMSGIAGALIKSGVQLVVGAISFVNDREASQFVITFYRKLFRRTFFGRTLRPARALLVAKNDFVEDNSESVTPYFYRLFGDPLFCRSAPAMAKRIFGRFGLFFIGALFALIIASLVNVPPPRTTTCNSTVAWENGDQLYNAYDLVDIQSRGSINLSQLRKVQAFLNKTRPPYEDNGPEGFTDLSGIPNENRFQYLVLPTAPMGALIAGLSHDSLTPPQPGKDSIWYVGKKLKTVIPYNGYLWFTVNDILLDSSRKAVFDLDPRKDSLWVTKWEQVITDKIWDVYFWDNGGFFNITIREDDRIFTRLFEYLRRKIR